MKKINAFLLTLGVTLACAYNANAQTLLDEDFETNTTQSISQPIAVGEGWSTVNSYTGDQQSYIWHNYYYEQGTIGGQHVAGCDGPTYSTAPGGGFGPREEVLLTPELNLDNTYELTFSWIVSPMNRYDDSRYDLQVRIVEDGDLNAAETIFSIQNQAMLRESGVMTFLMGPTHL